MDQLLASRKEIPHEMQNVCIGYMMKIVPILLSLMGQRPPYKLLINTKSAE